MDTIFFVYALTFANGKIYVGMSKTDKKGLYTNRFRAHANAAKRGQILPIYNAWRKYGAPVQTVLSTHATREDCALAEIDAIQQLESMDPKNGYNLQPGGQGLHAPPGSAVYELMRAKVWNNPERRRKSSEALKGRPLPDSVLATHKEWRESAEGKALIGSIPQRPEVRAKLSTSMAQRLAGGYAEYLSKVQLGKSKNWSDEGNARRAAARRAWLDSDEGKARNRAALAKARATPGAAEKLAQARELHAHSDANIAHCAKMAQKASKPITEVATGRVFESISAAARAYGVKGPTVSYWIKKGKFVFVTP